MANDDDRFEAAEAAADNYREDELCELCGDYPRERDELCEGCWREEMREASRDRGEDWGPDFADPGGNSALRAATEDNPRNLPCPNCGEPDRLTPADRALGYQCDRCADQLERGGY
jgi:hypothetical protein